MRKCPHCRARFSSAHPMKVYCSGGCRSAASNKRHRKRYPERDRMSEADWRAKECGDCGIKLYPFGAQVPASGRGVKYCGECAAKRTAESQARAYDRKYGAPRMLECSTCGKAIGPSRRKGDMHYCSPKCNRIAFVIRHGGEYIPGRKPGRPPRTLPERLAIEAIKRAPLVERWKTWGDRLPLPMLRDVLTALSAAFPRPPKTPAQRLAAADKAVSDRQNATDEQRDRERLRVRKRRTSTYTLKLQQTLTTLTRKLEKMKP